MGLLVARRIRSDDVLAILADLFTLHDPPAHIRSDIGIEFIATAVREWLTPISVTTFYITSGTRGEWLL